MKSKERVVFMPGLLCNERLWEYQVEALSDVAVCQVADLTRHDKLEEMVRSVLQSIHGRFSLVGLSMGGYVALELMRLAPERVKRLALIDTKARADSAEQKRRRQGLLALAGKGRFKGVTPHLMPMLVHRSRLEDEALKRRIFTMAEEVGKEAFVRQQTATLNRESHLEILPKIKCPSLVICGTEDAITPLEYSEEMAEGLPNSALLAIEQCGHLAPLETPEPVNAALRQWLACGEGERLTL